MDMLYEKFKEITQYHPHAFAETDMTPMYNPKRRVVIAAATEDMLVKAKSSCQKCRIPRFGHTGITSGLPCGWCGAPTKSPVTFIHSGQSCGHSCKYPSSKKLKDPKYCDFCNP